MTYYMHELYLTDDSVVEAQQVAWKLVTYYDKVEKVNKGQTKRNGRSKAKGSKYSKWPKKAFGERCLK